MSKVSEVKELLYDQLTKQLTEGTTIVTKSGDLVQVDPSPALLAVALNAVKTHADELEAGASADAKIEKLSQFLARRRPELAVSN